MRCELVNSINALHHWNITDDETIARLKYNSDGQSLRLTTNDKRLFFLERTGVLQSRILLKTEYSVVIGELHYGINRSTGVIELRDKKYVFHLSDNRLVLIEKDKMKILGGIDVKDIQQLENFELAALIFASALVAINKKTEALVRN